MVGSYATVSGIRPKVFSVTFLLWHAFFLAHQWFGIFRGKASECAIREFSYFVYYIWEEDWAFVGYH